MGVGLTETPSSVKRSGSLERIMPPPESRVGIFCPLGTMYLWRPGAKCSLAFCVVLLPAQSHVFLLGLPTRTDQSCITLNTPAVDWPTLDFWVLISDLPGSEANEPSSCHFLIDKRQPSLPPHTSSGLFLFYARPTCLHNRRHSSRPTQSANPSSRLAFGSSKL